MSFPDLPECFTQGSDINSSRAMASDALALAVSSRLEEGECVPAPSLSRIGDGEGASFVTSVEVVLPPSKTAQVY